LYNLNVFHREGAKTQSLFVALSLSSLPRFFSQSLKFSQSLNL
jgi:hypothetical protein